MHLVLELKNVTKYEEIPKKENNVKQRSVEYYIIMLDNGQEISIPCDNVKCVNISSYN